MGRGGGDYSGRGAALNVVMISLPKTSLLGLALLMLTSCGGHLYHRVERGETLYSIGWVYGHDYRQIARWNNIEPPYYLSPGQRIRVAPPSGQSSLPPQESRRAAASPGDKQKHTHAVPKKRPAPVVNSVKESARVVDKSSNARVQQQANERHDSASVITAAKSAVKKLFKQTGIKLKTPATFTANWRWPTKGRRVLHSFSANNPSRQGLDIAGEKGSAVLAAATGRVVYAGSGLVRYGQLIIIKHNEKYLSAYAHNQKLLVKEGDRVKTGQQIARMGRSGNLGNNFKNNQRAILHFEIRRNGKPVDPKHYLPR
jgi:lipoprotein NlpD